MTYLQRYFHQISEEDRDPSAIAFYASLDSVSKVAPSITGAIIQELRDQTSYLKLIASENYSSLSVQHAMGNLLTDKYAEGVPFHRFYAGCDNVDAVEAEAVLEAKQLFGADHAYVQPHSGSDANLVAYWAILAHKVQMPELGERTLDSLTPKEWEALRKKLVGQKLMGMSLGSGGHLSHGYRHNASARMMEAVHYEVDPLTGRLDYDRLAEQVRQEKPTILLAGYSSYPRRLNFAKMREIADSVGATLMVDMAHFAGLVAGKVFTGEYNPIPYAHVVTSTTHKTLRGPRGGLILCTSEYKEAVDKGCPMVLGGPLPHMIAAKAVAFKEASYPEFQNYAAQVVENAKTLAEEFIRLGATLFTGGTDNHLLVVDVRPYGLTGRQAEQALRTAHMTLNRNAIPQDPNGPWYTSGIRIGTPAITTLGMGTEEMRQIARSIVEVLSETKPTIVEKTGKPSKAKAITEDKTLARVQSQVQELLHTYPLYPILDIEGTWTKTMETV